MGQALFIIFELARQDDTIFCLFDCITVRAMSRNYPRATPHFPRIPFLPENEVFTLFARLAFSLSCRI